MDSGGSEMPPTGETANNDGSQDNDQSCQADTEVSNEAKTNQIDVGGDTPTAPNTEDGNKILTVHEDGLVQLDPGENSVLHEVRREDGGGGDSTGAHRGGGDSRMSGSGTSWPDTVQTTEPPVHVDGEKSGQVEDAVAAGDVDATVPDGTAAARQSPRAKPTTGVTAEPSVVSQEDTTIGTRRLPVSNGAEAVETEGGERSEEDETTRLVGASIEDLLERTEPTDTQEDQATLQPLEPTATETEEERPGPIPPPAAPSPQQVGLMIGAVLFALLAALVVLRPTPEPTRPTLNRAEVLQEELLKVEQSFRNQRSELWRRSRIHLQRHIKNKKPSEPVSLILAGGRQAERTLGCLAARLAEAFSTAYNGSVLQLDGMRLANVDHDQAKLELDNQLKKAFKSDKAAAVIHRLEELPPSSTLIFYRYCDHENAAYKHPLLAFTVLLPQEAVGPGVTLPKVEEMVHSHIHQKFLIPDQPETFDKMDVDKLSGLWSRISHLILPVNTEEDMEKEGCNRN